MKTLTTTVRAELVEAHLGSPSYRSTTPTSFRARSWNPAFKLISRLFAIFGLLMVFTASGWGESPDIGNSCVAAKAIDANSTTTGLKIDSNSDKDFFKIVLTNSGDLSVSSTSAQKDVKGTLYDSSCSSLAFNTGNKNFSISKALSAGTYYVSVEDKNNDDKPTYTFVSTFVPALPTLSISPVTLNTIEGNTDAVYTVTLSAASTDTVTVNYTTADGTATAGSDYTATSGTLTFAPGETTKTINVPIIEDTVGEPNETYTLTLSSPSNATIATATATGTITNDDPSSLSIADVSIAEGNSGTKTMTFTVSLTPAATSAVTVKYATSNGSATTAGNDYTAVPSTTLTFTAGQTSKTFTVTIKGDATVEPDETFDVNLTNPTGATISDAQAIGTILDDDTSYTGDNPRNFNIIYQSNIKGNIKLIGNSVLCEDDGSGKCTSSVPTNTNNNDITTTYYKLSSDTGDGTIKNSTSYTFALPSGVTKNDVVWAGLYWQGSIQGTPTTTNASNAKKVLLKGPGDSAYQQIDADTSNNRFNWVYYNTNKAWYYQGVKEITSIVKSKGAGTYQVANVEADIGSGYLPGHYGGWAIVLVYKDAASTLKNITVYDGFDNVAGTSAITATLGGFLTPSGGAVDSKFMIFGAEGDVNYTPDRIYLTQGSTTGTPYYLKADGSVSTTLGDYNPMNSSITQTGTDTREPNYQNAIGIDIDTYNVGTSSGGTGIIKNNQTGTTIKLSTGNDVYSPGVFAFSTDIYQPFISINKTANTSGVLSAGQVITYTADINNTGNEKASNIVIYDNFDDNNLTRTDGTLTNPLLTLGDLLVRDATAVKNSIVCQYGSSNTNCASSCTVTASPFKISCPIPTLAINETARVAFNVTISTLSDTQGQTVEVANKMYASYKNGLTGGDVPESSSNPANAGSYTSSGIGVVTPPPPPDNEIIPIDVAEVIAPLCDMFADGLQTRALNSKVDFSGGSGKLYNNPDTVLNTYSTPVNGGPGNNLTCNNNQNGDPSKACSSSNEPAISLDPIVMVYPDAYTFTALDTTSGSSITVGRTDWGATYNSGTPLADYVYNSVTAGGGVSPNILNFKVTNQLKLGTLTPANGNEITFTSQTGNDFELLLRTITAAPSTTVTADTLVKNIKIDSAKFGDHNTVSLEANQTIKVNTLTTSHTSTYTLTAPYININTLTDISGTSQVNHITLKADYIDIGNFTIGDATVLTIEPYTPGKNVFVKMNLFDTGSNNTINFPKGTYYIKKLNTSGSSTGYKWNMTGKVDLYLEDDWNTDSAIAINADAIGTGLATESHSASNLFIHSKGNITTKNQTRIVATIYSEKNVILTSASFIKGAVSAEDAITLGNGTEVYYDQSISTAGYGMCTVPVAVTKPEGQCGIFPSVLTSYDRITVSGNNAQVCSEQDLSYPLGMGSLGSLTCNASGCGAGTCSRIDPPESRYSVTFPTLPTTTTNLSSDQTISPNQTYSSGSTNEYRTFGDTTITGNSGTAITFTAGDYYFNSLSIPDNNAKIIVSGGAVRIFVKNDLTFSANSFDINKNGNASNLFTYVGGNLGFQGNGGGNGGMNAYFYVIGTTTVNNNTNNFQLTGGISSEGPVNITGNNPDFLAYTAGMGGGYGDCDTTIDYTLTGPFDAWDTFRSVSAKNISTKIVNKDFNLTIASLNAANTALEAKASGVKARYRLIDIDTSSYKTGEQIFDANATSSITSIPSFNVPSASRNMKVEFKYCADYNGTHYLLKADASCSAVCSSQTVVTSNNPCFRKMYSSDTFAIRPNAFKVFSQNLYKRAGEDFNITIKAIDEGNGTIAGVNKDSVFGITGYNASLGDLSLVSAPLNEKITITTGAVPLAGVNGCLNAGVFTKSGPDFVDGNTTATLSFSETGILDINLSEISGKEWAIVDVMDTNDTARYITPSTQSYDESNVGTPVIYAFIPYTIQTAATVNATTAQRWLYVNESYYNDGRPDVKPMGGILDYTITAKNKAGVITQNFDKECFSFVDEATCPKINGLKKNTTFDLFLDANITMDADRNRTMRFYTEDNASVAVWVLNQALNYTKDTPRRIQQWIGSKEFQSGVGHAKVYFNFDRNETIAIKPLNVSISDINTSTSWMTNAGATNDFKGMTPANNNLTFVYGRIIPRDVRVFGNVPFSANGWYEVYTAPTLSGTSLIPSRNNSGWYINTLHNDLSDGNANVTYVNSTAQTIGGAAGTDGMEDYNFAAQTPPYSAKAHINTDSWLWYGVNASGYADPDLTHFDCLTHPCFNINVVSEVISGGSSATTELKSQKSNKSTSTTGSGVTYDYTPVIR